VTADNVGVTGMTQIPAPGSEHPTGSTLVTIGAVDAAGNTNSVSFSVTVIDATPPGINAPPEDFTPLVITTGQDATVPLPDYTGRLLRRTMLA
jgi:hypothetical protein